MDCAPASHELQTPWLTSNLAHVLRSGKVSFHDAGANQSSCFFLQMPGVAAEVIQAEIDVEVPAGSTARTRVDA